MCDGDCGIVCEPCPGDDGTMFGMEVVMVQGAMPDGEPRIKHEGEFRIMLEGDARIMSDDGAEELLCMCELGMIGSVRPLGEGMLITK